MKVRELVLKNHLTTTFFDPDPNRVDPDEPPISERKIPIEYSCDKCLEAIKIETNSFEKHCNSEYSNLKEEDNESFRDFMKIKNLRDFSFLDFYCPKCHQATKILYDGGPSGYWGEFSFEIKYIIVLI